VCLPTYVCVLYHMYVRLYHMYVRLYHMYVRLYLCFCITSTSITQGHVKLVDFGLSKTGVHDAAMGASSLCGTPEYLSPEVLDRQGHGCAVDCKCSVYFVLLFMRICASLYAHLCFSLCFSSSLLFLAFWASLTPLCLSHQGGTWEWWPMRC